MRKCGERIETCIKEFGLRGMHVRERVARHREPGKIDSVNPILSDIFSLRIDADEYSKESFSCYYKLFEKYKNAITIFFSINSFKDSPNEIKRCKDIGLDIQSHGFYHYTYNDYKSNRYNIKKAKRFFQGLGIDTKGFAGPMGKWNWQLMRSLEDEGYEYSSDFAYSYLSLPCYPCYKNRISKVLEIPIFPVCPELFFQQKRYGFKDILNYYKAAIDEMIDCRIQVIIYAHTSLEHSRTLELLDKISEYAISVKGLKPMSMTEINDYYRRDDGEREKDGIIESKIPHADYIGKEIDISFPEKIKDSIKDIMDFEKITPIAELQCGTAKKVLKILARKII